MKTIKMRNISSLIRIFFTVILVFDNVLCLEETNTPLEYKEDPIFNGNNQYNDADYWPLDDDYDDYSDPTLTKAKGETNGSIDGGFGDYDDYSDPMFDTGKNEVRESVDGGYNDFLDDPKDTKEESITIEFDISLPWVQEILKKSCNEDIKCMERKAELIAREKIKTDLDLPDCGKDSTCKHYRTQLEKDYKERVYCPVTHPISFSEGAHCCPIQNWYDKTNKYERGIIKCLQKDDSNGCCNDVIFTNCSTKFCYDNPISYLNSYLLTDLKDSNPLCDLLSKRCQEQSIKDTCPRTCKANDLKTSTFYDGNILCNHLGERSCLHHSIRDLCPFTCGKTKNKNDANSVVECVDKKEWCSNYPNCETDIARQICPKACKLCTVEGKYHIT